MNKTLIQKIDRENFTDEEIPLSPSQAWFFNFSFTVRDHFHKSLEFIIHDEIPPETFRLLLDRVIQHHTILFGKFINVGDEIRQFYNGNGPFDVPFTDLSSLPDLIKTEELKKISKITRESIRISEPPIMGIHLIRWTNQQTYIIWAIHQLVIDVLSWKTILADFARVYEEYKMSKTLLPVSVPPFSYRDWSVAIRDYYTKGEGLELLKNELKYWIPFIQDESYYENFPQDFDNDSPNTSSVEIMYGQFGEINTELFYTRADRIMDSSFDELVLTALTRALHGWGKISKLIMQIEKSARGLHLPGFPGDDIQDMVGMFTTFFPFHMEIQSEETFEQTLAKVKKIRDLPQNGLSFTLLRFSDDEEIQNAFSKYREPPVLYDFTDMDALTRDTRSLDFQPTTSADFSMDEVFPYKLIFVFGKQNNKLNMSLFYPKDLYKKETVLDLKYRIGYEIHSILNNYMPTSV